MKKLILLLGLGLLASAGWSQAVNLQVLEDLNDKEDYKAGLALLEQALPSAAGAERAQVLTWLSRQYCFVGAQRRDQGASTDELLSIYEKGEKSATQALALDKTNALSWYWRSANIGRWAQTKGILDSLFKAGTMKDDLYEAVKRNPDHAASWNVLGLLYEALPGFPVSFGNVDYSVNLGRKSVDLMRAQVAAGQLKKFNPGYLWDLSEHLWARNWDAQTRFREQQAKQRNLPGIKDVLERGFAYEGSVAIHNLSDRQEAKALADEAIAFLKALPNPNNGEKHDLAVWLKKLAERK